MLVLSSGLRDGTGVGTASLHVLNTGSGAADHRTRRADLPPRTLRAALLTTPPTPARLNAWGLRPGRVHSARFNRSHPTPYPRWSDATMSGQGQHAVVRLWTRPVPASLDVYAPPSSCPYPDMLGGAVPAGLRVSVDGQVVFQDAALPSGRLCAAGYTRERVDVQGDRALLTVRAYVPGFEGPDAEPVFIAATFN